MHAVARETLLAQQLVHTQQQFERLKTDFSYNLQLLRERDAELERTDLEVCQLRQRPAPAASH